MTLPDSCLVVWFTKTNKKFVVSDKKEKKLRDGTQNQIKVSFRLFMCFSVLTRNS